MTDKVASAPTSGLTLDDVFRGQDAAAAHNASSSVVLQRRLEFLRGAVAVASEILTALPFADEKQHAIRVLSVDAWSSLLTSVRVGLWGNVPESLAVLRCGLETAVILAAAVETERYKTVVAEFAKKQRQLSFVDSLKLLGDRGKAIGRLHGDLSEWGSHSTGKRMVSAAYQRNGEDYDRFGCALDPEGAAFALRYSLDVALHLLESLESAYRQESRPFPSETDVEALRSRFREAKNGIP